MINNHKIRNSIRILCILTVWNASTARTNPTTTHTQIKTTEPVSTPEDSRDKLWVTLKPKKLRTPKPPKTTTEPVYYEHASDMVNEYEDYDPLTESPYNGIDYREQLVKHHVVPDFISVVPIYPLEIYYRNAVVKYGNVLTYNETRLEPKIMNWHHHSEKFYTVIMTDPDGPFGDARDFEEEWHHWLITNIYGHYIELGDVYAEYIGIIPSRGKHIHRYIFVVYEQPGEDPMEFDEIHLGPEPINMLRGYFSTKEFVKKYNLTGPWACNFFLGDWSKAPRPKRIPMKTGPTIHPDDVPDQECHIGEDIDFDISDLDLTPDEEDHMNSIGE